MQNLFHNTTTTRHQINHSILTGTQITAPRQTLNLFVLFAALLALPIIDLPIGGLSIYAPLMYLLALTLFFKWRIQWESYKWWLTLTYFFWMGILISMAWGTFAGHLQFGPGDILTLIRYLYWMLVFLVTAIIVSNIDVSRSFPHAQSMAVVLLALSRLAEAFIYGRWGPNSARFITQNAYGIVFSTFTPFLLLQLFLLTNAKRYLAIGGISITWLAILANGSRGSWIAVTIGAVVFVMLYFLTQPTRTHVLLSPVIAFASLMIVLALMPAEQMAIVNDRFARLQAYDEDKSYLIRELMIQKGLRLFKEHPINGVGIGRFDTTTTELDIPKLLHYAPQEHFNAKSVHNSYVGLLAEAGLLGTLPYTLLVLTVGLKGFSAVLRRARRGEVWTLAVYAGFVGMSLHFWSIKGLFWTTPWFMYGLLAGIIVRERLTRTNGSL